ncbi:MAG: hypothetical protein HQL88_05940 [Magnetococcales bacterium]|nr:hypothetical protein [Magnetococcales bacterium]
MPWIVGGALLLWQAASPALAQEEEGRLSDMEMLKQGQQELQQRGTESYKTLEMLRKQMEETRKIVEDVGKQTESLSGESNKKFKELSKDLHKRFEESGKRAEEWRGEMHKRVELYERAILVLFGTVILLLLALFPRTSRARQALLQPLEEKMQSLEQKQLHDARNLQTNITRLHTLLTALRELAKEDAKLAAVLRSFALLE